MIDRYREMEKAIRRVGMNRIPLRDEIELEYLIDPYWWQREPSRPPGLSGRGG